MQRWLQRFQRNFDIDTAKSLCNSLGIGDDKVDGCYMLVADLEASRIDNDEFTVGLSVLAGKKPAEVVEILKGVKANPKDNLAIACYNVLATHGRACHYTFIGELVRGYYIPGATDAQILSCLNGRKDLFIRQEPGVYWLRDKKEGERHPEIREVKDGQEKD